MNIHQLVKNRRIKLDCDLKELWRKQENLEKMVKEVQDERQKTDHLLTLLELVPSIGYDVPVVLVLCSVCANFKNGFCKVFDSAVHEDGFCNWAKEGNHDE